MIIKIRKIGNHWYLDINHDSNCLMTLNRKIEYCLNKIDKDNYRELNIYLSEVNKNIYQNDTISFNDQDLTDFFIGKYSNIRFYINNKEFEINSWIYEALEHQFNLNFHITYYKISIW